MANKGVRKTRVRDAVASPKSASPGPGGFIIRAISGVAITASIVWAGLLLLSSSHLPSDSSIQPWRERVSSLEASVAQLRQDLAKRNADVADLTKRLQAQSAAGQGQLRGLQARPAAIAGARDAGAGAAPGAALARQQDAGAPASGTAAPWSAAGALAQSAGMGAAPPAAVAAAAAAATAAAASAQARDAGGTVGPSASCDFKDDLDYISTGKEDVVEGLTDQKCCEVCASRNRAHPGSCAVAVMSSQNDRPPKACWLKASVSRAMRKEGVKACWPPGHAEIPPDPVDTDKLSRDEHKTLLATMASLATGPNLNAEVLRGRSEAIRAAMRHAWGGYKRLAWGRDELRPVSGRGADTGFSHAVTMVDSLDTLWIMGLQQEFDEAKRWLAQNLPAKIDSLGGRTSIFETTIRSLGGLLAAYDFSKDKVFLDLSVRLGNRIIARTDASGVTPYTFSGGVGGAKCRSLADSGTMQLEMRYLSHISGDNTFAEKADRFYDTIRRQKSLDGLYPNCYSSGRGKITFGADGDSFYEYLVKAWHQGGQKEDRLWEMYDAAVEGLRKHMVRKGPDSLTYLGILNWDGQSPTPPLVEEMEHLTCFVPGWLALGATSARGAATKAQRMELAANIAYTCWQMYERQPTGIGPERVKGMQMDLSRTDTREYILRPEALEGWWYMLESTQDSRYREWGWKTFQAFENHLWVPNGFASLKDVTNKGRGFLDRMESFFLAETMKYLFLLQDPDHKVKLDSYVFNTEGHPLSVFSRPA